MDASKFWKVISNYNGATYVLQIAILSTLVVSCILARKEKVVWLPKVSYGLTSIYLAFVFFLVFGTEPIQYFFAFPLYLLLGLTFIFEAVKHKDEHFEKFTLGQWILGALVAVYPLVSIVQGKTFPEMLLYIMPCPVVCIGVIIWLGYKRRNLLSLALLTIWGLTGIKAFFFDAYEDIILFAIGIYALVLFLLEIKKRNLHYYANGNQ
ncbi:DUF6064 family protein [Cellulosilyticum sp. I15G10I2]|uniref:DUF6064 family protein n=1 Tax=Cellulosilyticum sp. I15G10I2 TaxID=1892843 RepID=UPI00085BDEEB|nr:DUF6064 family protein [Cellulosilyticum sp. I15G10I2]